MESYEATLRAANAPVRADQPAAHPASGEIEQIEHEGQAYWIHAALKGAFLRQSDYTRKTQELSEVRRAVVADRVALDGHIEAVWSSIGDLVLWVALNRTGLARTSFAACQLDPFSHPRPECATDEIVFRR